MNESAKKKTKVTKVLESLRHDIAIGLLLPSQKLQMDNLKERYGVGYSPLREALSRLVTHGLVEVEEHCGFSVAPLSIDELHDLYRTRIHIETLALQLSIEHGDARWEADLLASWYQFEKYIHPEKNKKLDPIEWDKLQREFFFNLIKACHSPWLFKIRDMLYEQAERYRFLCLNKYYQNKIFLFNYIKENEKLLHAVLARNKNNAVKIMKANWAASIKMIEKMFTK